MAISIITIDGESYDVGASAGNVAFNNSGTGISAGTVQGAIEEISATGGGGGGGYEPPVGGIPKTDLASDVQTSLGKADTALQSESDPVFAASAAHGITSTDINNWNNKASSAAIPTKTSDLTNDSGFVTSDDVEDFVTADDIEEIVMGSADVSVVEANGYINIVFAQANITVLEDNLVLTEASPNGTFNVSGSHLKNDITVTAPTGFKVQLAGGTAQQSVTIPHVNGTVESTTVTVKAIPTVVSDVLQGNVELESGTASASVGVYYSQYAGPTIIPTSNSLSLSTGAGSSTTGTLTVTGYQLTEGITVAVSGSGFATSTDGTTYSTAEKTLPSSGGTLHVKWEPTGSTGVTGSLTLTSTGADSKTVTLTGAVSTLSVSPSSLTLNADVDGTVTDTFTVTGANLTGDVTLTLTDSNSVFSLSSNTLTKSAVEAQGGASVTVTYSPSAAGTNTGTVTIQSSGLSETIDLSGTAVETPNFTSENNYRLQVNGIYYDLLYDSESQPYLRVNNKNYDTNSGDGSYSGDVIIPSTVTAKIDGANAQSIPVKDIRTNAMSNCTGLTSIVIPDSVTGIHDYAFYGAGLTSVIIGNGVTAFANYCFGGTTTYDLVDFGENLADLGSNSVIRMKSTGKVYLRFNGERQSGGTTYYTVKGTSRPFKDASGNMPSQATLYVASGRAQYFNASNDWTTMFGNNITEITE